MLLKTVGERGFELGDLAVEFEDDPDGGVGGGGECLGEHGRGGELLGPQRRLDLSGTTLEVALPAGSFQR